MIGKVHPLTQAERDRWDRLEVSLSALIYLMEADGDYGPEWAKGARKVVQDMQDFIYWDPRDAA